MKIKALYLYLIPALFVAELSCQTTTPNPQDYTNAPFVLKFKDVDEFRAWYDAHVGETFLTPRRDFSYWNPYSLDQIEFYTSKKLLTCYLFKDEDKFRTVLKTGKDPAAAAMASLFGAPPKGKSASAEKKEELEVYGNVICFIKPPPADFGGQDEQALGKLLLSNDLAAIEARLKSGLPLGSIAAYNSKSDGLYRCRLLELAIRTNENPAKMPITPLMDLLLRYGADIDEAFNQDKTVTPLIWAIKYRLPSMAAALLERGADPNHTVLGLATPLFGAVGANNIAMTRLLLEHGGDPNIPNQAGETPIFLARGSDMIGLLVKHGARLDLKTKQGSTLIDLAMTRDNAALVNLLLKNGAELSLEAINKTHGLHHLATTGDLALVKRCVELGADINEIVQEGNVLYWANYRSDNTAMMEYLIGKGAVIDTEPYPEKTILTNAAWHGYLSNAALLIKHGAVLDYPKGKIPQAVEWALENKKQRIPMLKLLIAAGPRVKDDATTLLHMAVPYNDVALFEYVLGLFDHNLNLRNAGGETPVMIAAAWGNMDILRYLVKAGADLSLKSKKGKTVLNYVQPKSAVENYLKSATAP